MLSLQLTLVAVAATWYSLPVLGAVLPNVLDKRQTDYHWVDTWTSMPQLVEQANLPPSPFVCPMAKTSQAQTDKIQLGSSAVFADATLRQTLHISIPADRIRIQLSNTFGGSDLPITAASVGLPAGGKCGSSDIVASPLAGLTFSGASSVVIPKGQVVYSDPIDFPVEEQSMLTLSIYSQAGQSGLSITGHPGSRTTSWMQSGNHVNATSVTGASTKHWYFATAVEAWAPKNDSAWIILGDSITDGRGSTDDANNRWPDLVLAKMQSGGVTIVGVNNQAAGGNAVLSGGLGPTLLTRYNRDAIQQSGVKYVMIFEGVNDIGGAATDSSTQTQVGNNLIAAFKQITADCKKAGISVFAATITPFGGSGQAYSNPTREATRVTVNNWITTSGTFDAVVDFSKVVGDPATPSQLASQYDSGDHLHPNVAGYQAIANAFPIDIFAEFAGNTSQV